MMVLSTGTVSKQAHVINLLGTLGTGFTYAPVLEAGGKPSTRFPPEGLVELTSHARRIKISSDKFPMKKFKISKNLENVIFLKFYQNFEVTFDMSLVEQIDK